jgi:hypothetical protein
MSRGEHRLLRLQARARPVTVRLASAPQPPQWGSELVAAPAVAASLSAAWDLPGEEVVYPAALRIRPALAQSVWEDDSASQQPEAPVDDNADAAESEAQDPPDEQAEDDGIPASAPREPQSLTASQLSTQALDREVLSLSMRKTAPEPVDDTVDDDEDEPVDPTPYQSTPSRAVASGHALFDDMAMGTRAPRAFALGHFDVGHQLDLIERTLAQEVAAPTPAAPSLDKEVMRLRQAPPPAIEQTGPAVSIPPPIAHPSEAWPGPVPPRQEPEHEPS